MYYLVIPLTTIIVTMTTHQSHPLNYLTKIQTSNPIQRLLSLVLHYTTTHGASSDKKKTEMNKTMLSYLAKKNKN